MFSQPKPESKAVQSQDAFENIISYINHTRHPEEWISYYSQDLMDNPLTSKYYRLPDVLDLATFRLTQRRTGIMGMFDLITSPPTHIPRYTFTVVKTYLSSTLPRNTIVQIALPILHQHLMRLRASDPQVPRFSETKVAFWMAYMHAVLTTLSAKDRKGLRFETLVSLGLVDMDAWRRYYSMGAWEGIEARMGYVKPDRQAFAEDSVVIVPKRVNIEEAQRQIEGKGCMYELEGEAELKLLVEVAVLQVYEKGGDIERFDLLSRGELLYWLFWKRCANRARLSGIESLELHEKPKGLGNRAVSELAVQYWEREVKLASSSNDEYWKNFTSDKGIKVGLFREFLLENMHLVREIGTKDWNFEQVDMKDALQEASEDLDTSSIAPTCSTHCTLTYDEEKGEEDDNDDARSIISTAWEVV
jgi:hypothetical protein